MLAFTLSQTAFAGVQRCSAAAYLRRQRVSRAEAHASVTFSRWSGTSGKYRYPMVRTFTIRQLAIQKSEHWLSNDAV